jgi:hypothetical protein
MNEYKLYAIDWMEIKPTSTGKTKADTTLRDEQGNVINRVTIWGDFPNFVNIRPGEKVRGKIEEKGQYKSLKPEMTQGWGGTYKPKGTGIVAAMEKKEASIEKFQDKKQESIERSATFRDATLLATAYISKYTGTVTTQNIEEAWTHFYEWLTNKQSQPF